MIWNAFTKWPISLFHFYIDCLAKEKVGDRKCPLLRFPSLKHGSPWIYPRIQSQDISSGSFHSVKYDICYRKPQWQPNPQRSGILQNTEHITSGQHYLYQAREAWNGLCSQVSTILSSKLPFIQLWKRFDP